MINKEVIVNLQLQEQIAYDDPDFPLARFIDQLDFFAGGSFLAHWHPEYEIAIVLEGCVEYQLNKQAFTVNEGEGIFVGTQTLHSAKQLTPHSVIFNIEFPPDLFNTVLTSSLYRKYFSPVSNNKVIGCAFNDKSAEGAQILKCLRNIYETTSEKFAYELSCLEELLRIWRSLLPLVYSLKDEFSDIDIFREQRMRRMVAFIEAHFGMPITVEEIADSANISRSECFRCFTLFCHAAPMEYVNRYRLQCAAQMLLDTDKSVADICYTCGFSSSSYFGKSFHKLYGLTPSDFRKRAG